jgi:L-iditol 2-dehydrogenase
MKAIQFNGTIPRYVLGITLGNIFPGLLWSGPSCTYLADISEPQLPGDEWAAVHTHYGGICGSDMAAIHLHASPYFSPFLSFPFTFGHENYGTIAETGQRIHDLHKGQRIVVEPLLWCKPRGFEDLCQYCAQGEINRCERLTAGDVAAGLMIGNCRDTGGSWSEYFVAHRSQIYPLPDSISDENALLIEPFSVGLHAVLQNMPGDDETVLIAGAGSIGLCLLAALRALGSHSHVLVLARYPFQAQAARKLGANEVFLSDHSHDHFDKLASEMHARLLQPMIGKRVMVGGADLTFECVGNDTSLDDALRMTRAGGRVVLVGVPGISKHVDWTAIFANELDVRASYTYHHAEQFGGRRWRTFELAIDLMQRGLVDLSWMVTHRYPLEDYAQAFNRDTAHSQTIKSVFTFNRANGRPNHSPSA